LGDYGMVLGILGLMFIRFNRLWHFVYIGLEPMLCGLFNVQRLPVASTYWRYLNSLQIHQAQAMLSIMKRLREQVWKQCRINYSRITLISIPRSKPFMATSRAGEKGTIQNTVERKDTTRYFALLNDWYSGFGQ